MKRYLVGVLAASVAYIVLMVLFEKANNVGEVSNSLTTNQDHRASLGAGVEEGSPHPDKLSKNAGAELRSTEDLSVQVAIREMILNPGFEGIALRDDEFQDYKQWLSENGQLYEEIKHSDYASFDERTLHTLAVEGDMRAYEALRRKSTTSQETLNRLGLMLGASSGAYGLNAEMREKAEAAYEKGDFDAYRRYFIEKLAFLEFSKLRGMVVRNEGMERVYSGYKLEDDVADIRFLAELRSIEILEQVNHARAQHGLAPLEMALPQAVKRQQALAACGGDEKCMRRYIFSD